MTVRESTAAVAKRSRASSRGGAAVAARRSASGSTGHAAPAEAIESTSSSGAPNRDFDREGWPVLEDWGAGGEEADRRRAIL